MPLGTVAPDKLVLEIEPALISLPTFAQEPVVSPNSLIVKDQNVKSGTSTALLFRMVPEIVDVPSPWSEISKV